MYTMDMEYCCNRRGIPKYLPLNFDVKTKTRRLFPQITWDASTAAVEAAQAVAAVAHVGSRRGYGDRGDKGPQPAVGGLHRHPDHRCLRDRWRRPTNAPG